MLSFLLAVSPPVQAQESGLISLGDEEYHARASLDEKHNVLTIRLLDQSGKKPVAIDLPAVLVNLKANDRPRQFLVPPVSLAADPEGLSSRFVLQNQELLELLRQPGVESHFRVPISGRSYLGKLNFNKN